MLPYLHIWKITIPGYGLFMALGIILTVYISYIRLKKDGGTLDSLLIVGSIAMFFALTCAVGAYYIFSYGIKRLFSEIYSGNFSAFENAGMVYYGGLIGGIAGAYLGILINKYDFDVFCNAVVPAVPLGHAFGRIGCLLGGCCYGKPYHGFIAVHSVIAGSDISLFPIQLVESLCNFLLFFILMFYVKKQGARRHNTLFVYLFLYSIERFCFEFFRGDLIRGIYGGLSTSQWISIVLFSISVFEFAINRIKTSRVN